jgi:hypothetical protein
MRTYFPGAVPDDPAALPGFLRREHASIQRAANRSEPFLHLETLHASPARIFGGMAAIADGTDWNPGSGAGLYLRNEANDAWLFIVSLSSLLALANTWSAKQTFSDYTALGESSPAIKMKKLTGTTNVAEGGSTAVAHGLTQSKIISFQTLVTHSASPEGAVPAGYTANAGYEFSESLYDGYVSIENSATNSANILSKAFTVLITYEE